MNTISVRVWLEDRQAVEKLWTNRAFPVDGGRRKNISGTPLRDGVDLFCAREAVSYGPSLVWQRPLRTIQRVPSTNDLISHFTVNTIVQRFEESIGGRAYLFEVSPVESDRWRARIVKAPGVPTALMPFYATTADEAVCQLRQWLTRAHERAAGIARHA